MTLRAHVLTACCLAATLLAFAGCRPADGTLAPVRGKVTYKGTPVPGGTIVFVPDASRGTRGNLAVADIQPDGTFTLKTNDTLGAAVGHHRVTVACVQPGIPGQLAPRSLLPAKFRDPQQSGLSCEVLATKMNSIDIELD
jgi:hypothetical protein